MDIRVYPDPVLREPCPVVEAFDAGLADLASAMVRSMHENRGLGLAAPQVGESVRLCIVSPDGEPGHETVLVNPEITETDGWMTEDEGCLSFPGIYVRVGRHARLRVRYQDVEGRSHEMEAEGLLARAVQHELDHLDGRLLVNRMSTMQRMANRRRLAELQRRYEEHHAGAEVAPPNRA